MLLISNDHMLYLLNGLNNFYFTSHFQAWSIGYSLGAVFQPLQELPLSKHYFIKLSLRISRIYQSYQCSEKL